MEKQSTDPYAPKDLSEALGTYLFRSQELKEKAVTPELQAELFSALDEDNANDLHNFVKTIIADTTEVLSRLNGYCESIPEQELPEIDIHQLPAKKGTGRSSTKKSERNSTKDISDHVFFALMELKETGKRLHFDYEIVTDLCIAADDARRTVIQILRAIDKSILAPKDAHHASITKHSDSLREAIEVRKLFGEFAAALITIEDESIREVRRALLLTMASMAKMRTSPNYFLIRIQDHMLLQSLFDRIREWLQTATETLPGLRIYQDLKGTLELLLSISKRPELHENDVRIIDGLKVVLDPDSLLYMSHQELLLSTLDLRGFNPALDKLIAKAMKTEPDNEFRMQLADIIEEY